jgi:hypothetical protein
MGHEARAAPPEPAWVLLRVDSVEVKPARADGKTWDQVGEKDSAGSCGALSFVGDLIEPGLGTAVGYLCKTSNNAKDRDPTAPDLVVELRAGGTVYSTPIAIDTFSSLFGYSFAVPLAAVPADGLQLVVLDQDASIGAGELIGAARLSKKVITDQLAAESPVIRLSDSRIDRLEIVISAYTRESAEPERIRHDARKDWTKSRFTVHAGEVVLVTAQGTYSAADDRKQVGPEGYTDGAKQSYNVMNPAGFDKVSHASAIGIVGDRARGYIPVAVGDCKKTVAAFDGAIEVGINDDSRTNNLGIIDFVVQVGLPNVDEWRAPGTTPCAKSAATAPDESTLPRASVSDASGHDSTLTPAAVLAKIMSSYMAGIKRCYNDHLKDNPDAKGKVSLSFTVSVSGRTVGVSAAGFAAAVDKCIVGRMNGWRFPVPKDAGGTTTDASFQVALQLVP